MSTLERAIEIAANAHAGQRDKAGAPYILHPLRIMLAVKTPAERVAAVLHDLVEDTPWTIERLRAEGFEEDVLRAIDALTRRSDETYFDFVRRAAEDPIARVVKAADLRDNMDLGRIAAPSARDHERLERYRTALALLHPHGETATASGSRQAVVAFRPLAAGDLPLLREWLSRPHVAEWWGALPGEVELAEEYGPTIAGAVPHQAFIALDAAGTPLGFIQSYVPAETHDEGWWLDEHDPGVRGIDQFLADGDRLGRGLGTAMIRAFLARLFADPAVTRVQTDPDPSNARAIRCYEKSGFRAAREVVTPDGAALLMYCDRDSLADGE